MLLKLQYEQGSLTYMAGKIKTNLGAADKRSSAVLRCKPHRSTY
jgi:hypothetical protein